jgi:hypothetical protein
MPCDGTLTNFYVRTSTAQPAGGSLTLRVRKNATDTSLVVVIPAGSAAGVFSDTTNSVSYVEGDAMSVRNINAAAAQSTSVISRTFKNTV